MTQADQPSVSRSGWRRVMAGRWGFVLVLAALALMGGQYYYRIYIQNHGLKLFDQDGDKVYLVGPDDQAKVTADMVATAWINVHRHPELRHIRYLVYVDRKKVVDQFGQKPYQDIYLGDVHLFGGRLERFKRFKDSAQALAVTPTLYLDWMADRGRPLGQLAVDQASAPELARLRRWAASVGWVLGNMRPWSKVDLDHGQAFGRDWRDDPNLVRADAALQADPAGTCLGLAPEDGRAELVYKFELPTGRNRVRVRDIHTAWDAGERVSLDMSPDGRTWQPVYDDVATYQRRLMSVDLADRTAGWKELYLRYRFDLTGSKRHRGDRRGVGLYFLQVQAGKSK